MEHKPPRLAEKLLTKLLYDDVWKTTLGDFEEYYSYLATKNGKKTADIWYWKQVLRYAPSKIVHKFYWTIEMFFNYLKLSFRRLRTNKTYSFINISGLAVGLASFILIGLFVQHELSYDKHFEDSDRIYRVNKRNMDAYQGNNWNAVTPMPLHSGLKENFPQFEHTTYVTAYTEVIKSGADSFYEDGLYVGGEYFETFNHTWIYGNPVTALDDPEAIILTQSLSKKMFGNKNPVGESISIIPAHETHTKLKTVTGVIEDVPRTSHLYFSYIVNEVSSYWHENNYNYWDSNGYFTYVKLGEKASLNEELRAKLSEYYNAQMITQSSYNADKIPQIGFQPMLDIHLKSTHINHQRGVSLGDIKYMYFLLLIGSIILLIACVNYMNLATARAIMRAKEIGVRKVIGALKSNLIMQFISEAVLLSFMSIVLALALVRILFPTFTGLVNREIGMDFFTAPDFWLSVLGVSCLVGIIAGSYPAFYMSSLRPSGIFKNMTKGGKGNTFMRNALVMGQFSI
ncbi:MAG: ABC transporter permease, partial [Balneolales bacterium]|nr:ABC transporter permease [Balneolales bacterium]